MPSQNRDVIRMRHMYDAAVKAIFFARGKSRSDLDADEKLSLALVRLVEIIFALTDMQGVDYQTAAASDTKRFGKYFRKMLELGIYLAPSQFEAGFVSTTHTTEEIDQTIASNNKALRIAFA